MLATVAHAESDALILFRGTIMSKTLPIIIPHEADTMQRLWTAFPSAADLWLENLPGAQEEVADMVNALATAGPVSVLVDGTAAMARAQHLCNHANVTLVPARFGDIWLRDTGPIFARVDGQKHALRFLNNGWGGKYDLPHDDRVGDVVAETAGVPIIRHDYVLEGGALEFDGAGSILTTRECLLNPNRNGPVTETEVNSRLIKTFGAEKIIWLDSGLMNDHTDGHIDNLARFVAPGHALCQHAADAEDPNAAIFAAAAASLKQAGLQVSTIPSPGLVTDEDGEVVAASHMNYIIYNGVIVMPHYGTASAEAARKGLAQLFPQHRVMALPARSVLTGGGSFHCITQQEITA